MYLAVDGQLAGLLAVADPSRRRRRTRWRPLRAAGLRIVGNGRAMATDRLRGGGQRLGIDEVHGEVKPADKLPRCPGCRRGAARGDGR